MGILRNLWLLLLIFLAEFQWSTVAIFEVENWCILSCHFTLFPCYYILPGQVKRH